MKRIRLAALGAGLVTLLVSAHAFAQLRVISANPVEAALHDLAGRFEDEAGVAVEVVASGTTAIDGLLASDDPADVVVGTTASVDAGIANGQSDGDGTYVGRVGIGIVVRSDGPRPDISTAEALGGTALAADTVIYNTAGSGRNVEGMFVEMGIGERVGARSVRPGNAEETMTRIREGQGLEIGFGLLSEILPYEGTGIALLGPLPEELQMYTTYEAIVLERSGSKDAARAFVQFITRPEAQGAFAATGVD